MYLDPSFGGMLLQIIIAVIAAGGAIAFGMRRKIKALFKKNKKDISNINNQQASVNTEEDLVDMLSDKNN
jgi:hypothetical protein